MHNTVRTSTDKFVDVRMAVGKFSPEAWGYESATFVACRKWLLVNCATALLACFGASKREDITVTVNGKPVARLVAYEPGRRRWLTRNQLMSRIRRAQADPGLRDDLAELAGDTTDDLGPLR